MERVKRRGLRLPARASAWYIASSAVARSVSVVGTPIFTRLLRAEEYGVYPRYLTFFSLIGVVATLELSGGVMMRALQKFESDRSRLVSAAVGLTGASCLVCLITGVALSPILKRVTGFGPEMMTVMILHLFLNAVVGIYTAVARYEYRYKTVALTNLATAFLTPAVAVILITATGIGGVGRVLAALISTGAVALPFLFSMLRESRVLFDKEIWRYLLRFNLPLLPHYFAAAVIIRAGEIALSVFHGDSAIARYSVSMSVGLSLTVITNGLYSALSPWIIRRLGRGEIDEVKDILLLGTRGLCLISLLILAVVPEAIGIVCPPEYRDCLPAVYPLALSVIPMFLSNAVQAGEMYYERSGAASLPTVIAAAFTVALTLIIAPRADYRAVALFLPIAYVLTLTLNCLLFRKMSGKMPIFAHRVAFTYLLTVVYAALLFLLRNSLPLRTVALVPLLFPLFSTVRSLYGRVKEA